MTKREATELVRSTEGDNEDLTEDQLVGAFKAIFEREPTAREQVEGVAWNHLCAWCLNDDPLPEDGKYRWATDSFDRFVLLRMDDLKETTIWSGTAYEMVEWLLDSEACSEQIAKEMDLARSLLKEGQ